MTDQGVSSVSENYSDNTADSSYMVNVLQNIFGISEIMMVYEDFLCVFFVNFKRLAKAC